VRRVRINVHNVITNMIVEEQNEKNIPMIDNVITKRKTKRRKADVNVYNYSGRVQPI